MGTEQNMGRGGCHTPAATPGFWSPRFPPGQAVPGPSTAPIVPPGHHPACAQPCANSPQQPPLLSLASPPPVALARGGRCKQGGLGSPGSAGCPQAAPARSPALLPPPGAVPSPVSPALSGAQLFLSPGGQMPATKLKMWDTAPEQGRGCFSFPPWGWVCALSAALGIGCNTCSNHRLQSSETPVAPQPLGEEGRGPAGQWRR